VRREGHDVIDRVAEGFLVFFWAGSFSHGAGENDIATNAERGAEPVDEVGAGRGEVPAGVHGGERDAAGEADDFSVGQFVGEKDGGVAEGVEPRDVVVMGVGDVDGGKGEVLVFEEVVDECGIGASVN